MSAQINDQLTQFSNLINSYSFGSQLTAKTGLHFEKALNPNRPTLVPLFKQNRPVDYGPKVGDDKIQWASSGDESEVEITGITEDQR